MNKKDWERFFAPKILSRGFEYYKKGLVRDSEFSKTDNALYATVCGTEKYNVSIYFDDMQERIVETYCDCPYAEDGHNCKHIAALLYAFDDGFRFNSEKTDSENTYDSIENSINSLSEAEAKQYLLEAALKDDELTKRITLKSTKFVNDGQISQWEKKIEKIVHDAGGIYGFIEYDEAYDMFQKIIRSLDEWTDILLEKGMLESAFKFIGHVFDKLYSCEFDDSDGGYFEFVSLCEEKWKVIIDLSDITLKKKFYKWFWENDFEYLLFNFFDEDEFLRSNLDLIDSEIKNCSDENYKLSQFIDEKSLIMKKPNIPEADI